MADKQPWVLRKPGQRGQLTIPREWRLQLGWDDETQVIVSLDADHHQLMINEANSVVTAGLQAIPPTANRKDRQNNGRIE